jgi:hypothetical protein
VLESSFAPEFAVEVRLDTDHEDDAPPLHPQREAPAVNRRLKDHSTILWHTARMPDEYRSPLPRRNPEHVDLAAIKTDLEFVIERIERLPTRQELALRPLYVMVGSAGLVIAWIAIFWRHRP